MPWLAGDLGEVSRLFGLIIEVRKGARLIPDAVVSLRTGSTARVTGGPGYTDPQRRLLTRLGIASPEDHIILLDTNP